MTTPSRSQDGSAPHASALTATALGVLSVLVLAASWATATRYDVTSDWLQWTPTALAFTGVGWVVVTKQPRNVVGWLVLWFGVLFATEVATLVYSIGIDTTVVYQHAADDGHGAGLVATVPSLLADWAGWWRILYVDLLVTLLSLLLLLFPDGRLPSRRWRPVAALIAGIGTATCLLLALSDVNFSLIGQDGNYLWLRDPVQVLDGGALRPTYHALEVLELAGLIIAATSLVARFRSSQSPQREQIKWVTAASAAVAMLLALVQLTPLREIAGDGTWAAAVGLPVIPVSMGVAVLRYRLYDIDRIISRATSYTLLTGLLALTYAILVTSISRLLPGSDHLAVAAATLAAAAVARPALRRLQRLVDRHFDRPGFDAQATLDSFALQLRHQVDTEHVAQQLASAVHGTLQPATVRVWTEARR